MANFNFDFMNPNQSAAGNRFDWLNPGKQLSPQTPSASLGNSFSMMDPKSPGFMDNFTSDFAASADAPGIGSKIGEFLGGEGFQSGISAFSTLAGLFAGFKGLGLAKDQLSFQKKAWNKNYDAQVKDYENTLKDRWAARNAGWSNQQTGSNLGGMDKWVGSRSIK